MKFKSFHTAKGTINRIKRKSTDYETVLPAIPQTRGSQPKYARNCKKLKTKEKKLTISKWTKDMNRQFSKEETQMSVTYFQSVQ